MQADDIKRDLQNVKHISICADLWSTPVGGEPFLASTMHFIKDWLLFTKTLDMQHTPISKKATILANSLKASLSNWGALEKVVLLLIVQNCCFLNYFKQFKINVKAIRRYN